MSQHMKLSKNLSVYFAILLIFLLTGCGKKESDQYIYGYMSPGDFCQKGIAREKAYRFTDITPLLSGLPTGPTEEKSCSPDILTTGGNCQAVHCNWYASQSLTSFDNAVPTEGIAVNDRHVTPPTFDLKIFRVIGTPWSIEMVVRGVRYIATTEHIRLTQFQSDDFQDQIVDPDDSTQCIDSTDPPTHLNIYYIEFLEDVILLSDPNDHPVNPTKPYILIQATTPGYDPDNPPGSGDGDFMVVQAY